MEVPKEELLNPRFLACLREAAKHKELIAEFDRLSGSNLSRKGPPIATMIDDATGRTAAEVRLFAEFVYEYVYLRIAPEETEDG